MSVRDVRKAGSSLSRIHQLPRLETINLNFHCIYSTYGGTDLGRHPAAVQESIFRALGTGFDVRAPSELTSLSLHNLRTLEPPALELLPYHTILPTLRCLHLSVLADRDPDTSKHPAHWRYFWRTLFFPIPAVPIHTQFALMELTLHSNEYVGAPSGLSIRELHFPRLSVLSLGKIVFDPTLGAEVFILRHANTLSQLELLECKVLMSKNVSLSPPPCTTVTTGVELSPSPYWDRIWDRFAADLTALVTLFVDELHDERTYNRTSLGIRYVHYSETSEEYVLIDGNESRIAADLAALQRFDMTVAARARSKERGVES